MKPWPRLNELVIAFRSRGVAVFFLLCAFSSPVPFKGATRRRRMSNRGGARFRTYDASGSAVDDDYYV